MAERSPSRPERLLVTTGTKYEFQWGYSRAVRDGDRIRVSATAGLDDKGVAVGTVTEQARRAIEIIGGALSELGASFEDVIATRVYLGRVEDVESVAVVHGEIFRDIRPATSVLCVEFVDPKILVEIEAEAVHRGK